MPYLFSEFQEWLTTNPERQSELTNWNLALDNWKNNQDSWNKVLKKAFKKSSSDTPPIIQAVQQWLITKDNNSPTHETVLNRWQILSNQIITKKNNWQKEITNWEAKKETLTSVQSIIDNLITNLQDFPPYQPQQWW